MDTRTWGARVLGIGASSGRALTRSRIRWAYGIAVGTDVLQFALGPFGWTFADEILDVLGMVLTTRLLGFHPLLLPTFLLELVPIADMLPSWTACVALVVASRKTQAPPPSSDEDRRTIDVTPTSVT